MIRISDANSCSRFELRVLIRMNDALSDQAKGEHWLRSDSLVSGCRWWR